VKGKTLNDVAQHLKEDVIWFSSMNLSLAKGWEKSLFSGLRRKKRF
jgi:hypothetical protein